MVDDIMMVFLVLVSLPFRGYIKCNKKIEIEKSLFKDGENPF